MSKIVSKLRGGDRRSIGRADEVVAEISSSPKLFAQVFAALLKPNPVIRMRAADAIQKAAAIHPELLQPYKRTILRKVAAIDQQEVRWHVAQMLPLLQMTPKERDLAVAILFDDLEDKSC